MSEISTKWLVRTNGKILGPYSQGEVESLLHDMEIVVLDEVCLPCGRWNYIRDTQSFARVVEEIRVKVINSGGDTTAISGASLTDNTATIALNGEGFTDDLTEELVASPSEITEIVYENIKEIPAAYAKKSQVTDSYVFEGDREVQQSANKALRVQWVVASTLIGLVLAFVFYKKFVQAPMQSTSNYQKFVSQGNLQFQNGNFKEALESYKKAKEINYENNSINVNLAVLLTQLERQTVESKRLLQDYVSQTQAGSLKLAYTALGLAELEDSQFSEARTNFEKVIDMDHLYAAAILNVGATELLSGSTEKASSYFQLAIKDGTNEAMGVIMLVDSMIRLYEKRRDVQYLAEALKTVEKFSSTHFEYQQELQILGLYLKLMLKRPVDLNSEVIGFLDRDPGVTNNFKKNPFVYRRLFEKQVFPGYCIRLVQMLPEDPLTSALEAICNFKKNEQASALRLIEEATTMAPKHALLQSLHGFILDSYGLSEQASGFITRASELAASQNFIYPLILRARSCGVAQNSHCEQEVYSRLEKTGLKLPEVTHTLGAILVHSGKNSEAQKILDGGLRLAGNYKPLLNLKQSLEANTVYENK